METTQVNVSDEFEEGAVSDGHGLDDQLIGEHTAVSSFEFCSKEMVTSFENKKQSNPVNLKEFPMHLGISCDPSLQAPSVPGVSKCYVFKSQLQEYAQKVGLPTPEYETTKEGPSHEPSFRSTVIVDGVRYESLPGFFNRKAAEQSAAEIALMDLSKSGGKKDSIAVPVHETGLCKNLLQEYAQKMNYAIPTYICRKDDTPGKTAVFSCTVEIGAIQYIGAAARNKKDAEIKAARTALLAIRSSGSVGGQKLDNKPLYTVIPSKRKMQETAPPQMETVKVKKPKKPRSSKKSQNRMKPCDSDYQSHAGIMGVLVSNDIGTPTAFQPYENGLSDVQVPNQGQNSNCLASSDQDNLPMKNCQLNGKTFVVEGSSDSVVCVVDSSPTHDHRNSDVGNDLSMTMGPPSVQSDNGKIDQGVGKVTGDALQ
ncbi:double-stranded RNA-binding protein 3-like [Chenopodium quinoa]|uniref:DRBM domain-containing protein n=1 Tax=Chenopodium quinoa TaxID=63459 RepID=A0A803LU72_CHEQI|nr:double-stranded RNA-binding protein 3-like [Chenopodium quinoa]